MAAATWVRVLGLVAALLVSVGPRAARAQTDEALDAQCSDFAEEVIAAVLDAQPWDVDVLASRGLPDVVRMTSESSVSMRLFSALGDVFGTLDRIDDRGVEVTIVNRRGQRTVSCVYRATATFVNGPGVIVLQARLVDGAWRVQSLNVTSVPTAPLPTG